MNKILNFLERPPLGQGKKIHVCFVAPYSYSLFYPESKFPFGGIEIQSYILANELARRPEFNVSFIVHAHGQSKQVINGIQVVPYGFAKSGKLITDPLAYDPPPERITNKVASRFRWVKRAPMIFKILRLITMGILAAEHYIDHRTRLIRSWHLLGLRSVFYGNYILQITRPRTYIEIHPDIFISFGASELTGELAAICNIHKIPLILCGASDADFSADYVRGSSARNPWGCRASNCWYALTSAKRLIAQSERQRQLIAEHFGRLSRVILNPIDLGVQPNPERPRRERHYVLWIGKADTVKRPLEAVAIARMLPDIAFKLVVNPNSPDVMARVLAESGPNVEVIEHVKATDMPALMEGAFALLNTSSFEGFPNAFLEACRAGTPIVAQVVDPNAILTKEGCGLVADGDRQKARDHLSTLALDDTAWERHHRAAIDYVRHNHGVAPIVDQLIEEVRQAL